MRNRLLCSSRTGRTAPGRRRHGMLARRKTLREFTTLAQYWRTSSRGGQTNKTFFGELTEMLLTSKLCIFHCSSSLLHQASTTSAGPYSRWRDAIETARQREPQQAPSPDQISTPQNGKTRRINHRGRDAVVSGRAMCGGGAVQLGTTLQAQVTLRPEPQRDRACRIVGRIGSPQQLRIGPDSDQILGVCHQST